MSLFEYFIIYIVIWWIAFFISLPMGVKKPENVEIGNSAHQIKLVMEKIYYCGHNNFNTDIFNSFNNEKFSLS